MKTWDSMSHGSLRCLQSAGGFINSSPVSVSQRGCLKPWGCSARWNEPLSLMLLWTKQLLCWNPSFGPVSLYLVLDPSPFLPLSRCAVTERWSAVRPEEDGRPPRMRELALVGHRARPHRRAPQSDAGRGAGAGGAQVQTPGDGGRRSGGSTARCRQRWGSTGGGGGGGGGERDLGKRRNGCRAWLCDIPPATGQSVRLSAHRSDPQTDD